MDMEDLIWKVFRERYCDKDGITVKPLILKNFSSRFIATHPGSEEEITAALEK